MFNFVYEMEDKLSKIVAVRVTDETHAAFVAAPRKERRKLIEHLRDLIEQKFSKPK